MNVCINSPQDCPTSPLSQQTRTGHCGCTLCVACLHILVGVSSARCISSSDLANRSIPCPCCGTEESFSLQLIPSYMLVHDLMRRSDMLTNRVVSLLRNQIPQESPTIPITTKKLSLFFVACPVCLSYTLPVNNNDERFSALVEVSVPSSSPSIFVVDYTMGKFPDSWKKTNTYTKMRTHVTHCATTFFRSPFMEKMVPRFYQSPNSEQCKRYQGKYDLTWFYQQCPGSPHPSKVLRRKKNEDESKFLYRVYLHWYDVDTDGQRKNHLAWETAHKKYWDLRKKEHLLRLISADYAMPIPTHYDDATWKRISIYHS